MRIIAGEARSRPIKAPKGQNTRPTQDRVRESLFNILAPRVEGARVLDLYAGSGALALEALSRGAAHAVLVEKAREAQLVAAENLKVLGFEGRAQLMKMPDTQALSALRGQQFDLLFLDPPYAMEVAPVVEIIAAYGLMDKDALMMIEHSGHNPPVVGDAFEKTDVRRYGETQISFYRLHEGDQP